MPNAAYCPSRCGASSCIIKNWLPALFGFIALAIDTTPRLCFMGLGMPLELNSPLML